MKDAGCRSVRGARALSLALVLLSPRLGAQEREGTSYPEEENAVDPGWSESIEPEEINEMEELRDLERQLLEDLSFEVPSRWFAPDAYDGRNDHPWPTGATTFYRIPATRSGMHLGSMSPPSSAEGPIAPGQDEVSLRLASRFDLSDIEPVFGLEHLEYDQIQVYLQFYTTRGRRHLANGLARSGRYRRLIEQALHEAGLPRELVYLVLIESGFNPIARSHAGAVGLWQFMPRTARGEGLTVTRRYDERRDPEASTRAAIRHLSDLYDRFGSWTLAMAAYNAGAGHVTGEIRRYNLNDFWRMDGYSAIYDETRRYVYRIVAAALIGEHPERFGFEAIVLEPTERHDTVEVPGNTRLSVFARALDIDVETLMDLNPALLAARTPDVEVFRLHIPPGSLGRFIESYDGFSPQDQGSGTVHRLRFGETVEHLAQIYRVNARVIRYANGLESGEQAPYGSEIVIPLEDSEAQAILTSLPAGGSLVDGDPPVVVTPALQFDYPDRHRLFYQVMRDDEISRVADAFGVTPYDLALWNDVDPDAALQQGMFLQVYPLPSADLSQVRYLTSDQVRILALGSPEYQAWDQQSDRQAQARQRRYTVRRGDTVNSIAHRFGVRPSDIIRWNDLDDPDQIRSGQVLRIR